MRSQDLQQLRISLPFFFIDTFEMRSDFRQKAETILNIVSITLITCCFGSRYQSGISDTPFITCQTKSPAFQLRLIPHCSIIRNHLTGILIHYTGRCLLIYIRKNTIDVFFNLFGGQITISTLISRLQ